MFWKNMKWIFSQRNSNNIRKICYILVVCVCVLFFTSVLQCHLSGLTGCIPTFQIQYETVLGKYPTQTHWSCKWAIRIAGISAFLKSSTLTQSESVANSSVLISHLYTQQGTSFSGLVTVETQVGINICSFFLTGCLVVYTGGNSTRCRVPKPLVHCLLKIKPFYFLVTKPLATWCQNILLSLKK